MSAGRELPASERDKLERQLLAKAIAIILSPEWGRKEAGPDKVQRGEQRARN